MENREIITFKNKEEIEDVVYENNKDFALIEEDATYHDSEKGCVDYDVIIQRRSDNKFFKLVYTQWQGQKVFDDLLAKEVFPEIIKTTIYK